MRPPNRRSPRRARIAAELDGLGRRTGWAGWAGRYVRGDGLATNVVVDLAPESGFVFTWSGCLGTYDQNHGSVSERDDGLHPTFTWPNARGAVGGLASVLVPVRWGERRYLIAKDELIGFAVAVNGGSEPRNGALGHHLLRQGDWERAVTGKPGLPPEALAMLLDEPVSGTLTAVDASVHEERNGLRYRLTDATIDRGAAHGLKPGHVVRLAGRAFAGTGLVVTVGEDTARIRIRALVLGTHPTSEPTVGQQWSTRRVGN